MADSRKACAEFSFYEKLGADAPRPSLYWIGYCAADCTAGVNSNIFLPDKKVLLRELQELLNNVCILKNA